MARKNEVLKVPFLPGGNLSRWGGDSLLVTWKDNYVWEDELEYNGYGGGRSAMTMYVRSVRDGREYPVFFTFFDALIRRPDNGLGPTFKGKWTFCKRGRNYSVMPVGGGS